MVRQTAVRTEGTTEYFRQYPAVKAEVDEGYLGLTNEFPCQVSAPPREPKDIGNTPLTEQYGWREMCRRQSSRRICVEHANAEHRQWRRATAVHRTTRGVRRDPPCHRRPGF